VFLTGRLESSINRRGQHKEKSSYENQFKLVVATLLVGSCLTSVSHGAEGGETLGSEAARSGQSIADSVRPEVRAVIKESISKVMENQDNDIPSLLRGSAELFQSFLETNEAQPERDLLQILVNIFDRIRTLLAYNITGIEEKEEAGQQVAAETAPELRSFVQQYVQSPQLKDLLFGAFSFLEERALQTKTVEMGLLGRAIDLYDNPNLDAQTRAEFNLLIGMFPERVIDEAREALELFKRYTEQDS
jgi:hypothetical protein